MEKVREIRYRDADGNECVLPASQYTDPWWKRFVREHNDVLTLVIGAVAAASIVLSTVAMLR